MASRGTRLIAVILDSLIAAFALVPLAITIVIGVKFDFELNALLIAPSVLFIIGLVITNLTLMAQGQTLGKKACNIRVYSADGRPASFTTMFFMRFILGQCILGIIPFYSLINIMFIFGKARRCLHDKIASTYVGFA
ncbi:MAG: RDD family protein [Myxococcales bacterium]|nr:RDD family protein [Myxococcales bacterium]